MISLDSAYWNNRYLHDDFSWDLGEISTPLKVYIDQLTNRSLPVLVPGAGNAYEAAYLHEHGFANVHILDFAEAPLAAFRQKYPAFPVAQLHCQNFFEHKGQYDLVLEQTFFCAINPALRQSYAAQMHALLRPGGKLVGLLFNDVLNTDKPPFGGNMAVYRPFFEPYFNFRTFEPAYNSIKPRLGRELFIILEKK